MSKRVFDIDGNAFDDLEGFFAEFRLKLGASAPFRSLDAFNDVLRGGFGTPDGGFVLRWLNSDRSRRGLGHPATVGDDQTVFDILVEIIRTHGPGGEEEEDGVELELA